MATFFWHRVFLPSLALSVLGMLACCGCGGDQKTATSTTGNASQASGPPPPPVIGGQADNSTVANLRSDVAGSAPPGAALNIPGGAPASPDSSALASNDPGRNVPPADLVPDGPPVEGFEIGSLAPEIEGDDLEGEPMRLSDYRGKVVVVDFWGDW